MGVALDIVRAWRSPRQVMQQHLAAGPREDRVLMFLLVGCLLVFVAQFPRLWRDALVDPSIPFEARLGGAMLGWVFIAPLAFYLIAAISRILSRFLGGQGSWYSARLALFWALLVASPLWLLDGIIAGLIGPGMVLNIMGIGALLVFVIVWGASLYQAERRGQNQWT